MNRHPEWTRGFDEGYAAGEAAFQAIGKELARALDERDVARAALAAAPKTSAPGQRPLMFTVLRLMARQWRSGAHREPGLELDAYLDRCEDAYPGGDGAPPHAAGVARSPQPNPTESGGQS